MKLAWVGLRGGLLLLSSLLIFGVIAHHERLGYLLMALFFTAEIARDFIPYLRRRLADRSAKPLS